MAKNTASLTTKQIKGFFDAAQSLKLYRRAELQEEDGESLIEKLYVDPLPNDFVYETVLKPNTTFLIGRKGTGKSTIFQRVQAELRKRDEVTSAYVDIKTVFEQSQVDTNLMERLQEHSDTLPPESLKGLLLHKAFIRSLIGAIQDELKRRLDSSFIRRRVEDFTGGTAELFAGLDELLDASDADAFINVVGVRAAKTSSEHKVSKESKTEGGLKAKVSDSPSVSISGQRSTAASAAATTQTDHADILMRYFNIKEWLLELKLLLKRLAINRLYVFIDDFSELPIEAMTIVVDTLLAPLNNWSEELIKFKVAAYPGRVYYGDIDKTKIDELYLDLFKLYGTSDVATMEEKAIDFTRRLVERRLEHFCDCNPQEFLTGSLDEFWRLIFYATMANPRNLGYILYYLYESHLVYSRPLGSKAAKDASQKYYEDKIEPYFAMSRFLHESFAERSSIYSLKELLEEVVRRARVLKTHSGSAVVRDISGTPPTSHFHVLADLESILSTLELNFFVTKYYEMSDRDGRKVVVFALNYGLCQKYSIEFGRPTGKREFRLYFVERIFDYSPILNEYLKKNQEVVCDSCSAAFDMGALKSLEMYGFLCPKCRIGTCRVVNLSRKYESLLKKVHADALLPKTELGILQTLHIEKSAMIPADIAAELDCSYQLVGKRGKNLGERGLVDRLENDKGRRVLAITKEAEQLYFSDSSTPALDVPEEPKSAADDSSSKSAMARAEEGTARRDPTDPGAKGERGI